MPAKENLSVKDYEITFSYGIGVAKKDNKYMIITSDGSFVSNIIFDQIVRSPLGIALVQKWSEQWIVDAEWNFLIEMWEYEEILDKL